jgi:hypothetical protein
VTPSGSPSGFFTTHDAGDDAEPQLAGRRELVALGAARRLESGAAGAERHENRDEP